MIYSKADGRRSYTIATCELCPWQEGQPVGARIDRMHAIIDGHMASAHPIDWSRKADRLAAERDQEWADGLDERLSQVVAEYCGYVDGAETTADGSADNDLAMERTEALLGIAQEFRMSSVPEQVAKAARWGMETLAYGTVRTVELRLIDDGRIISDPVMNHADQAAEPEPVMVTDQENPGLPPAELGANIVKALGNVEELMRVFITWIDGPRVRGYRAVTQSDLDKVERLPTHLAIAKEALTRLTATPRRGV